MAARNHFPMGVSSLGSPQTWFPLWLSQTFGMLPSLSEHSFPGLETGAGDSAQLKWGWGGGSSWYELEPPMHLTQLPGFGKSSRSLHQTLRFVGDCRFCNGVTEYLTDAGTSPCLR